MRKTTRITLSLRHFATSFQSVRFRNKRSVKTSMGKSKFSTKKYTNNYHHREATASVQHENRRLTQNANREAGEANSERDGDQTGTRASGAAYVRAG